MKKSICIFIILTIAFGLLSGCGTAVQEETGNADEE